MAIDAKTGAKVWDVPTFDKRHSYVSTGAPRVAKGLVFIGNGGGEYGVRGYISAYDAASGKLKWRFYTVPGDPRSGPDHAASDPQMAIAAKTWTGEWWKYGGGGTVWDAIVYDPELDQLYFGVGNGSPWDRKVRSPGGGDNLFLSSIVAVKPETGEYLWHFQETPGETWDFTATQPIVLATLKLGGTPRKVIMHAPKDGFFYVLDRQSGKFISGQAIIPMAKAADTPKGMPISWAYGLDPNSRPLENPEARYLNGPALVTPSGLGAHNWQPMSYSPQTGLVYIPVRRTFGPYESIARFEYRERLQNTGNASTPSFGRGNAVAEPLRKAPRGELLAWDPVTQKPVWSVPSQFVKNGGSLATAGGLVFWPEANGTFAAFDARNGHKLWSSDAGMSMVGPPITYRVNGVQYLAVMSGAAFGAPVRIAGLRPKSRVLVYRLGGKAVLPPYPKPDPIPAPPHMVVDAGTQAEGAAAYAEYCAACHGGEADGMSVVPDLRRSPVIQEPEAFRAVLTGSLADRGMPDFARWISAERTEAIRAHIASLAARGRERP